MITRLAATVFLFFASNVLFAQKNADVEISKIRKIFERSMKKDMFKDTNTVYMFSLKVDVIKDNKGKYYPTNITSSDSIAYSVYTDFKFLKRINYNILIGDGERSTFVFPIAIFLESPHKKNIGLLNQRETGDKLVNYLDSRSETYNYIYIPALNIKLSASGK